MATVAVLDDQKGKVDRSALLGRLMWYSVPESTILDYGAVISELTSLGLTKALPRYPADHDVFRRASKSAERRKVQRSDTEFENWMIRDVASRSDDTITRRIVVEVVDRKGRRLSYEQIADIEFERPLNVPDRSAEFAAKIGNVDDKIAALGPGAHTQRQKLREYRLSLIQRRDSLPTPVQRPAKINFAWLNGFDDLSHPTAKEIMAECQVSFSRWRGKLGDQAIREWIRKQILIMGATPVRPSGGVYFLEERYADNVEAMETFVEKMLPPGGDCHSVEIPNNDKQREMVRRAIEAETIGEIERMMVEIANVRRAGKLTPKRHLAMLSEVRILEKKMANYSKLLEKDLGTLSIRLKLLDASAKGLGPLQTGREE